MTKGCQTPSEGIHDGDKSPIPLFDVKHRDGVTELISSDYKPVD